MEEKGFVMSNPYFFRIIAISAVLVILCALVGGFFYDVPLQEPAEIHNVPNPSKSAWFLLWMQEVVSYHAYFIYAIFGLFVIFLFLPFLIKRVPSHAEWFAKGYAAVNVFSMLAFLTVVLLTVFAYFFRGEYWSVVFF